MESTKSLLRRFSVDRLAVEVFRSRKDLGQAAGRAAAGELLRVLKRQSHARAVFACAPSQNEFLDALTAQAGIAWRRVTVFHMDEYVGLAATHPASFRSYLREHLTTRVTPACVHELAGDAADSAAESRRYAGLLAAEPIDVVCLGIGENGHIAFNDPPVADFHDPAKVKVVELDAACRRQQVNDQCFSSLAAVPRHALTLTVPALMSGARLFCMVPGARKATAIKDTLRGPITTACPASILRTHPAATLYLDLESANLCHPEPRP